MSRALKQTGNLFSMARFIIVWESLGDVAFYKPRPRYYMKDKSLIIDHLFNSFNEIRYVAIYAHDELIYRQKQQTSNSSSTDTDKFEELLVNPTLLTMARQRGNIDCGGLRFIIVGYGNFYQLVKEINDGHISICLEKNADLTSLPEKIFDFLVINAPGLI